jgi:hypothetical protein
MLNINVEWLRDVLTQGVAVGAIVGTILGIIQFRFNVLKRNRDEELSRAKFGYELIDAIFENDIVQTFLDELDTGQKSDEIRAALVPYWNKPELLYLRNGIDWLLLYLDRVEHAITCGLTEFEVVRMPLGYYVWLLAAHKNQVTLYVNHAQYDRVLNFLNRFELWRTHQQLV